jgi:hypothetical protein
MWNILGSETLMQEQSEILKGRHYFEDMHEEREREMILELMIRRRAYILPDLIIGFQNSPFCQENGMHSESNHNRF